MVKLRFTLEYFRIGQINGSVGLDEKPEHEKQRCEQNSQTHKSDVNQTDVRPSPSRFPEKSRTRTITERRLKRGANPPNGSSIEGLLRRCICGMHVTRLDSVHDYPGK